MSKQIGLSLPSREKPGRGAFDFRPRRVEQWIAGLPRANLGETARQVFSALVESNQLDLAYQDRTRFLEAIREPVHYVTEGLRRHFVGAAFPLPDKSQKVAAVSRKIFSEMAIGYCIAVEDLLGHSVLFTDTRLLGKLIHRAITLRGREMLTSYQAYAPYQAGRWEELHKLYNYASTHKLSQVTVADSWHPEEKSNSADEYKRVLLTALAAPYRLRQGEVSKVYQTLAYWAPYSSLAAATGTEEPRSGFIMCADDDKPPHHLALRDEDAEVINCSLLHTDQLTEVVREEIRRSSHLDTTTLSGIDMQRPDLSYDLLCRLLATWTGTPKRVFSRSQKEEPVQIAMGLSTAHQFIAGAGHAPKQQAISDKPDRYFQPAEFNSVPLGEFHQPKRDDSDPWSMIYPSGDSLRSFTEGRSTPPAVEDSGPATDKPDLHAETWHIVNESAGGYCLENEANSRASVQVGELMGVRRSGDGHTWKWGIGVVRWLNFSELSTLRVGIEMLTPDAAAAGLRVTSEAVSGHFQRTLMLPQISAIKKPATLVTPPVPYREGSKVTVRILSKEMNVLLTRQIENTGLFAQFQFNILDEAVGDNASTTGSTAGPAPSESGELDLQQVWSSI